jgi:hypothetical protein
MGFEPTIPASERAKTGYALDRGTTVIGCPYLYTSLIISVIEIRWMRWAALVVCF